jgi:Bacterial regulatory proteins, tetR family
LLERLHSVTNPNPFQHDPRQGKFRSCADVGNDGGPASGVVVDKRKGFFVSVISEPLTHNMRKTSKTRWLELVEAATQVFLHKGYKRTQMADITDAMGLSAGAIYRYVESKEGLFDLVVRAGELRPPIATPQAIAATSLT